jgi:hypothetical protein
MAFSHKNAFNRFAAGRSKRINADAGNGIYKSKGR